MDAVRNPNRPRIIMPDNPPPPPVCVECHKPIIVLIVATTPRNPRRHIVAMPAAFIRTGAGPVCGACWEATHPERTLVAEVAATCAPLLEPVRLPAELPAELQRIYTRNGKVVRVEPLAAPPDGRAR